MKYIISVLLLCVAFAATAQVRHVRGIKSVEGGGGVTRLGTAYYVGYVNYFSSVVYGKYNLFYERGNRGPLKYTSMGADVSACYSLKPVKEFFYFNLRIGATASADRLNPSITVYDDAGIPRQENYSTLKVGLFGGFETEAFLTDRVVIIAGANQRMMFKTDFGKNRFFLNLGVRYNL